MEESGSFSANQIRPLTLLKEILHCPVHMYLILVPTLSLITPVLNFPSYFSKTNSSFFSSTYMCSKRPPFFQFSQSKPFRYFSPLSFVPRPRLDSNTVWDLCWIKWDCDRFLLRGLRPTLLATFHRCSISLLIFHSSPTYTIQSYLLALSLLWRL
jgi:hypothetical protein